MNRTAVDPLHDVACSECNYPLRGLAADRCPECGVPFVRAEMTTSPIAWERRAEIGTIRAYLKTLWQVFFRGREIKSYLARPLSILEAKKFWATTCILLTLIYLPLLWPTMKRIVSIAGFSYSSIYGAVQLVGILLGFMASIGVGTYFIPARNLPQVAYVRALAVWYYQSPFVGFSVLVPFLVSLAYRLAQRGTVRSELILGLGIAAVLLTAWCWWRITTILIVAGRARVTAHLLAPVILLLALIANLVVWSTIGGTVAFLIVVAHTVFYWS